MARQRHHQFLADTDPTSLFSWVVSLFGRKKTPPRAQGSLPGELWSGPYCYQGIVCLAGRLELGVFGFVTFPCERLKFPSLLLSCLPTLPPCDVTPWPPAPRVPVSPREEMLVW